MSKWNFDLTETGAALKEMIHNSDGTQNTLINICKQIQTCYEAMKLFYRSDEDMIETLDDAIAEVQEEIDMWCDDDMEQDVVDALLNNLYDFCDDFRIWIG